MENPHLIVLTTFPDQASARAMAAALVEARLAACVNIVPGLTSIYRWKGAIEEGTELLLLVKTTSARYAEVEESIRSRHPYELAEVVALPLTGGSQAYLDWIAASSAPADGGRG